MKRGLLFRRHLVRVVKLALQMRDGHVCAPLGCVSTIDTICLTKGANNEIHAPMSNTNEAAYRSNDDKYKIR